jgi:hypothetical protein
MPSLKIVSATAKDILGPKVYSEIEKYILQWEHEYIDSGSGIPYFDFMMNKYESFRTEKSYKVFYTSNHVGSVKANSEQEAIDKIKKNL